MSQKQKQGLVALASGALFGVGLALSGMTQPRKVIGFLDVGGDWDASLGFVMLGAISIHFLAYRLIRGSAAPLFADEFALPKRRSIDPRLIAGAAVFGAGWGLAGYCPGPGIVSLGSGSTHAIVFVASLLLGMLGASKLQAWRARGASPAQTSGAGGVAERAPS